MLDYHTVRSTFIGHDEFGHPQFDTQRSEIGELLYRFKYQADDAALEPMADALASFVSWWKPAMDMLVPVPAARARLRQPVQLLATALGARLGLPVEPACMRKVRDTPELKNLHEYGERVLLLAGAFEVDPTSVRGRRLLIVDDLFRSGATMNAIATALHDQGDAGEIFALAVTRTRSHR